MVGVRQTLTINTNPFQTPIVDRHIRLPPLPTRRTGHFRQRYFDSRDDNNNPFPSPFIYYGKNGEEVDINDPECVNNKSMFILGPLFYCSIGR